MFAAYRSQCRPHAAETLSITSGKHLEVTGLRIRPAAEKQGCDSLDPGFVIKPLELARRSWRGNMADDAADTSPTSAGIMGEVVAYMETEPGTQFHET